MINSKNLNKITFGLIIFALIICAGIVYIASTSTAIKTSEYEEKMFGDNVLTIDIEVDEKEWQSLLDNPMTKEYISGDLIINGRKFSTVGIRTKGNSSLSQVASMEDSDRYSLQFKSNKFVKGQTFYGLDSFCINNIIGDSTYMKDYIAYDLMNYIGVDTPLTNYANVTVNGEDFGFYIALERYDKSFLDRVYNTSGGELYNVKTSMGQKANSMQDENMEIPEFNNGRREGFNQRGMGGEGNPMNKESHSEEADNGEKTEEDIPNGDMEGFPSVNLEGDRGGFVGMGDQGEGSLIYIDDSISRYSSIFDNAVFSKNSDKDKERVITAIKNLNEGNDLEKYIDVDNTLRYLAAHTVVVNLDSYSSNMAQNYYLYEKDGKLTILPWDYNYSFGGFQSGSSADVINFPIDTPVSGVSMEDRPLINKLLEVEEYKEKYHEYLQEIVDGYFLSGLFEETINSLNNKINKYVKNDPSSFITYEEYQESLPVLIELGNLRAESINGQLNGTIPSTTEEQESNKDSLVNSSNINLSSLGNMGRGFGGKGENLTRQDIINNGSDNIDLDRDKMQEVLEILKNNNNSLSDQVKEQLLEIGLSEEEIEQLMEVQTQIKEGENNQRHGQGGIPNGQGKFSEGGENFPGERNELTGNRDNFQDGKNSSSTANKEYVGITIFSILLLIGALGLIFKSKKNY